MLSNQAAFMQIIFHGRGIPTPASDRLCQFVPESVPDPAKVR
jgi:hypothetical protein